MIRVGFCLLDSCFVSLFISNVVCYRVWWGFYFYFFDDCWGFSLLSSWFLWFLFLFSFKSDVVCLMMIEGFCVLEWVFSPLNWDEALMSFCFICHSQFFAMDFDPVLKFSVLRKFLTVNHMEFALGLMPLLEDYYGFLFFRFLKFPFLWTEMKPWWPFVLHAIIAFCHMFGFLGLNLC